MSMLEKKTKEKNELLQELEVFKENDPELMEKMQNETRVALDAANRWTGTVLCMLGSAVKVTSLLADLPLTP